MKFEAPAGTVLEPDTSYWIMVKRTGNSALKFEKTASDSQDSLSVPGRDIGALRFYRPNRWSGPWSNSSVRSEADQLMLRVIGYPRDAETVEEDP